MKSMHSEIKEIMAKKFKDEHCCFTEKDIKVELASSHIEIQIKGYEHIAFKLLPEKVDVAFIAPYTVTVYEYMPLSQAPNDKELVGFHDSNIDFPFEEALIELAYHISRTF